MVEFSEKDKGEYNTALIHQSFYYRLCETIVRRINMGKISVLLLGAVGAFLLAAGQWNGWTVIGYVVVVVALGHALKGWMGEMGVYEVAGVEDE